MEYSSLNRQVEGSIPSASTIFLIGHQANIGSDFCLPFSHALSKSLHGIAARILDFYCVVAATAVPCVFPSILVGGATTVGGITGSPIPDSTLEKVYVAGNATNATLTQVDTSLGLRVKVAMGAPGTDLYTGTPDN